VPCVLETVTEQFRNSEFGVAGLRKVVQSLSADCVTKAVRLTSKKVNLEEEEFLTYPSVYMDPEAFVDDIAAMRAAWKAPGAAANEEAAAQSVLQDEFCVAHPTSRDSDSEAFDADDDAVARIEDPLRDFLCGQQIHALRQPDPSLKQSAKLSEQCLGAAVCHHGFVVRGSAMSSRYPENFKIYFDMFNAVLEHRFPLCICIDNACQCGLSWETRHPDLAQMHPFVEYRTPLWHGAAHNERCRFTNSMTFKKGAGRRHRWRTCFNYAIN